MAPSLVAGSFSTSDHEAACMLAELVRVSRRHREGSFHYRNTVEPETTRAVATLRRALADPRNRRRVRLLRCGTQGRTRQWHRVTRGHPMDPLSAVAYIDTGGPRLILSELLLTIYVGRKASRQADRIRTCDPLEDPVDFRSPPIISRTRGFPCVYREPGGSLAPSVADWWRVVPGD